MMKSCKNRVRMGSRARFRVSWRLLVIFLAIKFITASLGLLVFSALANSARAEMTAPAPAPAAAPTDDAKVLVKSVTGPIVAVTKRSISVEFKTGKEVYEMLLPFDPEMTLERVRNVNELKRGDTVTVGYRQTYREDETRGQVILGTVATSIALVKSNAEGLRSAQ